MATEPLDADVHEKYLDIIAKTLTDVHAEIKKLRKDIQDLASEISHRGD